MDYTANPSLQPYVPDDNPTPYEPEDIPPEFWDEPDPEPKFWDDEGIGYISDVPYLEMEYPYDAPDAWEPYAAGISPRGPYFFCARPIDDYTAEELLGEDACTDDQDDYLSTATDDPPSSSDPSASPKKRAKRLSALAELVVASGDLLLTNGQSFAYQIEQGCFRPIQNLDRWLAEFFGPTTMDELLSRDLAEITNRLSWAPSICCSADDLNAHPELVNLTNGVFNTESGELLPHDKEFRFTYTIHAAWLDKVSPTACPIFNQFCRTSLDDDPAKRQLLLELIGYILLDCNDGKCALFLQGQPNSGKSVIVEFISRLFNPGLVSHIPLHQLGDRFFRAELAGRKLNAAGEIAGRALADISIFKAVTGNDQLVGEFKGQNPFYFRPRCKLLFSGNTLPTTTETDATAAFLNRVRVLLFNRSVEPEDQDKCLLDKLWSERDAIVTLALKAAQQLAQRNFEFTLPDDSRQFLDSFALRGNMVSAFIDECCVLDADARVFNLELYAAFEAFCERNGLKALTRPKFYELLSGLPHVAAKRLRIDSENRQGHLGIALKEPR